MNIYFDNSATTTCRKEVADLMYRIATADYGNPSSMHHMGVVAENYIREAAGTIASTLKVKPDAIYFTSGGTESDNMAIFGTARAYGRKGRHIITTAIEHPAVYSAMRYLEKEGFEVTYLSVDENGLINMDELESALRPDTILVSVMHTNNEVGSVMPLAGISALIRQKSPEAVFHVDAVQGYGKYVIHPEKQGIDLLSASGHKIHGPKGTGFLYKSPRVRLVPLIYGGGQQKDLRPGTENVAGIAGLGLAAALVHHGLSENVERMRSIRDYLSAELTALPDVYRNAPASEAPHILNVSFTGVRSEVMLHSLEDKSIYVSSGSACTSNKKEKQSPVLKAMGLSRDRVDSAIRISLSELNTMEEAESFVDSVGKLLPMLRRFR